MASAGQLYQQQKAADSSRFLDAKHSPLKSTSSKRSMPFNGKSNKSGNKPNRQCLANKKQQRTSSTDISSLEEQTPESSKKTLLGQLHHMPPAVANRRLMQLREKNAHYSLECHMFAGWQHSNPHTDIEQLLATSQAVLRSTHMMPIPRCLPWQFAQPSINTNASLGAVSVCFRDGFVCETNLTQALRLWRRFSPSNGVALAASPLHKHVALMHTMARVKHCEQLTFVLLARGVAILLLPNADDKTSDDVFVRAADGTFWSSADGEKMDQAACQKLEKLASLSDDFTMQCFYAGGQIASSNKQLLEVINDAHLMRQSANEHDVWAADASVTDRWFARTQHDINKWELLSGDIRPVQDQLLVVHINGANMRQNFRTHDLRAYQRLGYTLALRNDLTATLHTPVIDLNLLRSGRMALRTSATGTFVRVEPQGHFFINRAEVEWQFDANGTLISTCSEQQRNLFNAYAKELSHKILQMRVHMHVAPPYDRLPTGVAELIQQGESSCDQEEVARIVANMCAQQRPFGNETKTSTVCDIKTEQDEARVTSLAHTNK